MSDQASGSLRLFTFFGINVFVHWSWFLAGYVLYQMSGHELPVFLSIYLSLFGIVLLHEFGHALACRSVGGIANRIVLWPLGGIAFVRPPHRPGAMLWSIAAGPLVNVVLVPVTIVLFAVFVGDAYFAQGGTAALTPWQNYIVSITFINILLLVFNILPIYPLDGGQIVQSILWFFLGYARSLRVAAAVGLVIAVPAGLLLAYMGDWWGLMIAVFIAWQAWNGLRYANMLARTEAAQARGGTWVDMPPQ